MPIFVYEDNVVLKQPNQIHQITIIITLKPSWVSPNLMISKLFPLYSILYCGQDIDIYEYYYDEPTLQVTLTGDWKLFDSTGKDLLGCFSMVLKLVDAQKLD